MRSLCNDQLAKLKRTWSNMLTTKPRNMMWIRKPFNSATQAGPQSIAPQNGT